MALSTAHSSAALALEIDGKHAGFVTSFDGGGAHAAVVETPGTGGPTDKSLGAVQYDDIVVTCPFPDDILATWVTAFLDGKSQEHDGAVIVLNLNRQPVRRLEWQKGSIFSVTFPRLDATEGKRVAELTIAIRPTTTREAAGGGTVSSPQSLKAKSWLVGNFMLSMPGIDCTRVTRVEPVVVTQTYLPPTSGRGAPTPGPVHVSDLVVTVQLAGLPDFARWGEDFIVTGNNSKAHEKDATVRFLDATMRAEVGTLKVLSTGIFRVDHDSQVSGVAKISQVTVSMYAEHVQWAKTPPPVVPPAEPPAQPTTDRDVRNVLGQRLPAADVVRRLREAPAAEQRPDVTTNQRRLGRDVGFAWAQRHASLTELREVADADQQDWTSLSLPQGHTLAETLAASADIPLLPDGRLELPRDALSEGVLSGVLEALAELNEQVDG